MKKIFITGDSRGIGSSISDTFSKFNNILILTSSSNEKLNLLKKIW